MVGISKKHEFILYALVRYLRKLNKRFEDKPLEASVSKIYFIRMVKDLRIAEKSVRSLYKNLEILEKKKFIKYDKKTLRLTEKGLKIARKKEDELLPFIKLIVSLEKRAPKSTHTQTHFK